MRRSGPRLRFQFYVPLSQSRASSLSRSLSVLVCVSEHQKHIPPKGNLPKRRNPTWRILSVSVMWILLLDLNEAVPVMSALRKCHRCDHFQTNPPTVLVASLMSVDQRVGQSVGQDSFYKLLLSSVRDSRKNGKSFVGAKCTVWTVNRPASGGS